ncbi:MAG: hypothetical protein JWP58_1008, partial [Hymenobacter sp.]|nr:hypothetical protein [Hymenobacter sp.]
PPRRLWLARGFCVLNQMEKKNKFAALLWLPLLALCYWVLPQVPLDFALKTTGMFHDEIDTFSGKYSRPGIERPAKMRLEKGKLESVIMIGDSTVSFVLTQLEKRELYLFLQQINYAYYPDNISAKCEHQIVPSHKVELVVRANNEIKHISYEDGCEDNTTQNKELRHFINSLYEIAKRHEAVRRLPETMMFDL